jgi:hypothetical protein
MTHTVMADDYKVARTELEGNRTWEILAEPGRGLRHDGTRAIQAWIVACRVATWLKDCADNYATATTYEDLSRLSDTDLKHRGLNRALLSRDLNKG